MRRELAKSLAIALLTVSAIFLMGMSLLGGGEPVEWEPYVRAEAPSLSYLGISGIAVYDGTERLGALYRADAIRDCLSASADCLTLAFDSASGPVRAAESDWRVALASPSIYMTFFGQLPAAVLWDAFSAAPPPQLTVCALVIAPAGERDRAELLLKDGGGEIWRLSTELPAAAIAELSQVECAPVRLAAELGEPFTSCLEADTLLSDEIDLPVLTVESRLAFGPDDFDMLSRLLVAFSVDPYADSGYTDAAGRRVYKSDLGTLALSKDGRVHYYAEAGGGIPCSTGTVGAVLDAQKLLHSAAEEQNITYHLESISEKDGRILTFGASVGGMRVMEEHSLVQATVTVRAGKITEAHFRLFYSRTSDLRAENFLTGREAYAAFCTDRPRGKSLMPVYSVEGETVVPVWILTKEG